MFDVYGDSDASARKRLATSTLVSFILLAALGTAVALAASGVVAKEEKEQEVVFQMPPPTATPAPPPPPQVAKPPDAKVRKVSTPRPVAMVPKEIPKEELQEADESQYEVEEVGEGYVDYGQVGTIGGDVGAPPAPPPPPAPKKPEGPVRIGKGMVGPKCVEGLNGNAAMVYPEEARQLGIVGKVRLEVLVTADGRIKKAKAIQGKEPFVSAAIETVRSWKCDPAPIQQKDGVEVIYEIPIRFELQD